MNEKEIIKAYCEGQSMTSLAKEFHTYPVTIQRILEKNNVELRHDVKRKGILYAPNGDKLIEWAKAQGRPVTKAELAKFLGKARLSPSYFIQYPELGQYVTIYKQDDVRDYHEQLYSWLKENKIPYKPNDKGKLGVSVSALLLGEYTGTAIQIAIKSKYISVKKHEFDMKRKQLKATEKGFNLIFLDKKQFENLDSIKGLLNSFKKER